ncbi:hypothetical protein ABFO63_01220 [Acinetobacter junii]|uniref:hypothetical protein n=1 Tax=Acinetobacter junii TaxID=40215 RepID=UPI003215BDAF
MKLTVISNTFCLAVIGSSYAVTERNKDKPIKLCDEFHDFYPAQNTTDQNGCSS